MISLRLSEAAGGRQLQMYLAILLCHGHGEGFNLVFGD